MATILYCFALPLDSLDGLEETHRVIRPPRGHDFSDEELRQLLPEAEVVCTVFGRPFGDELMALAPRLRLIANYGVGYDNIDLDAARARGIAVTNTPRAVIVATAELTFALLLACSRRVVELDGLRVTSLERTAEDCARFLPPDRGLAVVDSLFAIAAGAGDRPWNRRHEIDAGAAEFREALLERLDARPRERGVRRARAVVMAATPWSQSVWETEARRLCLIDGIAAPQPQMPVRTEAGVFYADLGWRAAMLAYEIDGEIKYLQDADAALSAQYRRETAIEAAGVHVERATPADVADGEGFLTGLRGVLPQSLCEENPVTALRTPFEIRRQGASW